MRIIIPTRNRLGKIETLNWIPSALADKVVLLVHEKERLAHEKMYPGYRVVAHSCRHLTQIRQWVIQFSHPKKVLMLDDDLKFYVRKAPDDWHLRYTEPLDFMKMYQWIRATLTTHYLVGISSREGNNRIESDVVYCTRMMRAWAMHTGRLMSLGVSLDKAPPIMADFHIVLQLLTKGYSNAVSANWAQGHRSSNTPGGCSDYRTQEMMDKGAEKLAKTFPLFVTKVKKKTKTGWNDIGERTDVRVQWKKAYEWGKAHAHQN